MNPEEILCQLARDEKFKELVVLSERKDALKKSKQRFFSKALGLAGLGEASRSLEAFKSCAKKVNDSSSHKYLQLLYERSYLDEASEAVEILVNLQPTNYRYNYLAALFNGERFEYRAAIPYAEKALKLNSNEPEINLLYANLLLKVGSYYLAKSLFERAITIKSKNKNLLAMYAHTLRLLKQYDECLHVTASIQNSSPDSMIDVHCAALRYLKRHEEIQTFLEERQVWQKNFNLVSEYVKARLMLDHNNVVQEFLNHFKSASERLWLYGFLWEQKKFYSLAIKFLHNLESPSLIRLLYLKEINERDVTISHCNCPIFNGTPEIKLKINKKKKIRVGFVSGDFRHHSVSYFLSPLFESYSRDKFEFYAYFTDEICDDVTRKLEKVVDKFNFCGGMHDALLNAKIVNDGIDILIDLAGHSAKGKLSVFAKRSAPVQLSWLGYPATTGCPNIDYRIVDKWTDPTGVEKYYSETLIKLSRHFSVYSPPTDCQVNPSLSQRLKTNEVVFGSFNNIDKLTDEVISLWSNIIKAVPNSILILKTEKLSYPHIARNVIERFRCYGVSADRLMLNGYNQNPEDHWGTYNNIDIALDPFPYNGTTTSLEAMWMGVPVVTLKGKVHRSRVGYSQMVSLGLERMVAKNEEQYIQIAIELSANLNKLLAIKLGLREKMLSSSLMDKKAFTNVFENTLTDLYRKHLI